MWGGRSPLPSLPLVALARGLGLGLAPAGNSSTWAGPGVGPRGGGGHGHPLASEAGGWGREGNQDQVLTAPCPTACATRDPGVGLEPLEVCRNLDACILSSSGRGAGSDGMLGVSRSLDSWVP